MNIVSIYHNSFAEAFYAPQHRVWELLIGALVACIQPRLVMLDASKASAIVISLNRIFHIYAAQLGLLLLGLSFFLINKEKAFPSWWALMPTIGTALIILSGPTPNINKYIFSNRVLIWVGLLSYPLYLWHWPILSFARIISGGVLYWKSTFLLVMASLFLAWITFEFIEKPIRTSKNFSYKILILISLLFSLGVAGFVTYKKSGFQFRFDEKVTRLTQTTTETKNIGTPADIKNNLLAESELPEIDKAFNGDLKFIPSPDFVKKLVNYEPSLPLDKSCISQSIGKSTLWTCDPSSDLKKPKILLVGDSMAQAIYPGYLSVFGNSHNVKLIFAAGCPPIYKFSRSDTPDCTDLNNHYMEMIKFEKPEILVLSGFWGHNFPLDKIREFVLNARKVAPGRVNIIGEAPLWSDSLSRLIFNNYKRAGNISVKMKDGLLNPKFSFDNDFKNFVKDIEEINFISVGEILCKSGPCTVITGKSVDSIVQIDSHHYSPSGAKYIVSLFPQN